MYEIQHRTDLNILEVVITGFLTEAIVDTFARDLATALAGISGPVMAASLYDFTDAAIQSQAVVARLQALARTVQPGRRVALYTGGQLARMQARRVAAECPTMALFADRDAAIAWLTAPARELAA